MSLSRLALPLLLAALLVPGLSCKRIVGGEWVDPREAVLERQRKGLESLIAAASQGPLIPFDEVLVIVDEKLVQGLLASATPYERIVANRYRVRLDSATVEFEDGFALVRLDGRASLAQRQEEDIFADVSVYGGLDIVSLDPASGVLRGRVNIIGFEARRVGVLGVEAPVQRLVEDLSREKVEEFNVLASGLEIPVRLEREITVPAVGPEGEVRIEAATVPLRAEVRDVKAFRGKLWVSVGVQVVEQADAPVSGEGGAPGGGGAAGDGRAAGPRQAAVEAGPAAEDMAAGERKAPRERQAPGEWKAPGKGKPAKPAGEGDR